jgi:transposase-like protein
VVSGAFRLEPAVTQPIERDAIYRRRRFPRDVIETCVRWYLTYRLSYRDLVALMAERDVHLTHTTIMRWVFRFVPEYEKRWNRRAKPVGSSWRVDETFIHTRPKMGYLYRAVDKDGKTVDSLFQIGRGIAAAMAFFRKALASCAPRWPRKITLDGHRPSHSGLRRLRREDYRWKYVLVRRSCYLNNVVEQDHRAIKGRCQPMLGFKSYRTAALTLAGLELVHRIRKRQFKFGPGWWSRWSLKKQWDVALA